MSAPLAAATGRIDVIGYAAAIIGAALLSSKPIFIKLAYAAGADASALLGIRMAFALPLYLVVGWMIWRRRQREGRIPVSGLIWATAANGLLGYYVASYLDFVGLEYITAQLNRLILFTYPFFVVLLGALFFEQPLKPRAIPALLVAYTGVAIVFTRTLELETADAVAVGSFLVLLAAISFALFQLFGRMLIRQLGGSGLYTSVAMLSACGGVLIHTAVADPIGPFTQAPIVYALGFGVAVVCTVLPTYILNFALGRVGADGAAMVGNAGPMFTLALAALLLGEPFGVWEALGAALVIGGMTYFMAGDKTAGGKHP